MSTLFNSVQHCARVPSHHNKEDKAQVRRKVKTFLSTHIGSHNAHANYLNQLRNSSRLKDTRQTNLKNYILIKQLKITCTLWPETKVTKRNWWNAGQGIYTEKYKIMKFSVREIAEEISQEMFIDWRTEQWHKATLLSSICSKIPCTLSLENTNTSHIT